MRRVFFGAVASILLITGCKKYEDGPGISLRSKKDRLCKTWICRGKVYNTATGDSVPQPSGFWITLKFIKDGSAESGMHSWGSNLAYFDWKFNVDKTSIEAVPGNINASALKILRLTHNEFWFVAQTGSPPLDGLEYHMTAK